MLEQKPLHLGRRLCNQQAENGSWSAFQLRPGGSDTWTTSCCLRALEELKTQSEKNGKTLPWLDNAIAMGWKYLNKNKKIASGIGFNSFTPNDADSSVWLCRALAARAYNSSAEEVHEIEDQIYELLEYIKLHLSPEGNKISTYNMEDKILEFVNIEGNESAWLDGHDCVTANAEALAKELEINHQITISKPEKSYLKNLKNGDKPYWWDNSLFCKIILNEAKISRATLPNRLTLRVPNHNDKTGSQTTYNSRNDTERSTALDNGCFETCLRIINLLQLEGSD